MKRTGQLWKDICCRDNLRLAALRALRGKRDRKDAREFVSHLDERLSSLASSLDNGSVKLGRFHQFVIHDPKERIITAPCFEERVLHHAVINVCEPSFERFLIDDTFACRRGKGREAALVRARNFARQFPVFLTIDVRKYFDSVPHVRLLDRLSRIFKDQRLLDLLRRIIASYRGRIGTGLPIGSLTSQHLANSYLGGLDRFVKETLRLRGYVRYMDDMALWGNSTAELREALESCRKYLREDLSLELKSSTPINRTTHGMDFLGCRLYPTHLTLNRRSRIRFQRNLARLESLHREGLVTDIQLQQRVSAMVAFATAAGVSSWQFRAHVLHKLEERGHKARTG
jgi:retron-type reverse transcriptase